MGIFVFVTADQSEEEEVIPAVVPVPALPTLLTLPTLHTFPITGEDASVDVSDSTEPMAATGEYQILETEEEREMEANADAIENAIKETKVEDAADAVDDAVAIDYADAIENKDVPDSIEDNMIESTADSKLIDDIENGTSIQSSDDTKVIEAPESASELVQDQDSLGAISRVNMAVFLLCLLVLQ